MFKSIRNLFSRSAVVNNEQEFTEIVWNAPYDGEFHKYPDGESPCLSQSELQMLQRIVADRIREEELYRSVNKQTAKHWSKEKRSVRQSTLDSLYKEVQKSSQRLKKLSALQYRLKHKIAAKG